MSTILSPVGKSISAPQNPRNHTPLIFFALACIGLIAGFYLINNLGSSKKETFSFVGSSIKPGGGGGGGDAGGGNNVFDDKGKDAAPAKAPNDPVAKTELDERKIVYTATLDVVVKDVEDTLRTVERLLATHKARLSRSEARSDTGRRRSSTITLEVPVHQFRPLLSALKELGAPEREAVDSKDVTEEYVDMKARLKNLREQEDKLNELLKEKRRDEKLEDIIRVSDRIAEVRQVVERVEGRMKYLDAKAAFSTITLTVRETQEYKPPTTEAAPVPPSFNDRISSSFEKSWGLVVKFAGKIVLFFVTITPWLPVIIPVGIALLWLVPRLVASTPNPTNTVSTPASDKKPE